jgi:hypothetical protein
VRSPALHWPDSALLEQLLASGLLRRWLQAQVEQALVADRPEPDASVLANLQQAVIGAPERDWCQWCEQQGVSSHCLQGLSRQVSELEACKREWFEPVAHGLFLEQGSALDQVWFSVLQTHDADLAQEWFFKLQDGDVDYADLAPESLGGERFSGGSVGPIRIRDLQSPLDLLLRRIRPGVVQPPLLTPAGRHWLVRLNQRLPARWEGPLIDELIGEAYRQWLNSSVDALLARCPSPGEPLTLQPPHA